MIHYIIKSENMLCGLWWTRKYVVHWIHSPHLIQKWKFYPLFQIPPSNYILKLFLVHVHCFVKKIKTKYKGNLMIHTRQAAQKGILIVLGHGWQSSFFSSDPFFQLRCFVGTPKLALIQPSSFECCVPCLVSFSFELFDASANLKTL